MHAWVNSLNAYSGFPQQDALKWPVSSIICILLSSCQARCKFMIFTNWIIEPYCKPALLLFSRNPWKHAYNDETVSFAYEQYFPLDSSHIYQTFSCQRTSWVWVLKNTTEDIQNGTQKHINDPQRPSRPPLPPLQKHPHPFTNTFSYATEVLDRFAQGVLKGVLIMEQDSHASPPSPPSPRTTGNSLHSNSSKHEAKKVVKYFHE